MSTRFNVYGDESLSGEKGHVVYGLLICPIGSQQIAQDILSAVKEKFKGSADSRLHCREILHPDKRARSPWAHLNNKQALDLISNITDALADIGLETRVGHVIRSNVPDVLPGFAGKPDVRITDIKQLIPYAYGAAVGQLCFDEKYADNCSFWISPESSVITWFGGGRRQVDRLLQLNRVNSGDRVVEAMMTPVNIESKEYPPLLEVADLLAYATLRHLINKTEGKQRASDKVLEQTFKCMGPVVAEWQSAEKFGAPVEGVLQNFKFVKRH